MAIAVNTSRRSFVSGAIATLTIGVHLPNASRAARLHDVPRDALPAAGTGFEPNAFVRIGADNTITVVCKHIEFGQGPYTGVGTIVAEEMDADWSQIRVVSAPADVKRYANLYYKTIQGTGGSTAMNNSWDHLRAAGAEARARLVAAAASQWKVGASEITVEKGVLRHPSGKSGVYGEFVEAAQDIAPVAATPKDPKDWKLIGGHVGKVDTVSKTNGTARYTIDVQLPDMLTCVIVRSPRFGGKVKSFDGAPALAVRGFREVFVVPQGVAVLAEGYWQARKGANAVRVEWDDAAAEMRGSAAMIDTFKALADAPGAVARTEGDADAGLGKATRVIEATFTFPYLAHAPLEPNDSVIRRTEDGGVELIFGCQMPTVDQAVAAKVLGLQPEQVKIDTLLAGGSFGRRATPDGDMAVEAAEVMKAATHKGPIKVIWSREDDVKGGRYRPVMVHKLKGGVDPDGNIVAWRQVIAGQSFIKGSPFEPALMKDDGVDPLMVEGASTLPYTIPNLQVSAHISPVNVPTLWWRSVGATHTAFATEVFLDKLAALSGTDPLEIRRKLLTKAPRHLGALNLAAEKAGWGSPLPAGKARGIAVHENFGSFVAHVVEVSMGEDGLPKVERVVVAIDCGIAINPDIVRAQMEGGAGYGLSACLYGAVDLDDGVVRQSNFHDYRVLRINEMPRVEVHIVPSDVKPTGVGEPGVPPIAPAVANAWASLTGRRVRDLPFSRALTNA